MLPVIHNRSPASSGIHKFSPKIQAEKKSPETLPHLNSNNHTTNTNTNRNKHLSVSDKHGKVENNKPHTKKLVDVSGSFWPKIIMLQGK